jgi:hypothetical protein
MISTEYIPKQNSPPPKKKETKKRINYLEITITKEDNRLTFAVYRKPTTIDYIIHNDSCHPNEHKKSAIN